MGVFARLSDILTANVNALIDRVENPEVMLAQIVREMEEGLAVARRYAATAIAAERGLARELEHSRAEVARWQEKARTAMAAGREDLARLALHHKKDHEDLIHKLEAQYAAACETSAGVRSSLRLLEARLDEARRRQRALVARHRAARARAELLRGGGCLPGRAAPAARFESLENKLTAMEEELLAQVEVSGALLGLEQEFADLETRRVVEDELRALKAEQDRGGADTVSGGK
jgi:phage shock protein A